jgi:hypothetical protein
MSLDSGNLIPYNTFGEGEDSIFAFYDGTDRENFTPFTAKFLNTVSKQLLDNDNNIGNRVREIEYIVTDGEIKVDNLTSNVLLQAKDINVSGDFETYNINSSIINSKIVNIETQLVCSLSTLKNAYIEEANIVNEIVSNSYINELKVKNLSMNSEKYFFRDENIEFIGTNPGISNVLKEYGSTGSVSRYYDENNDIISSGSLTLNITEDSRTFDLNFSSELPGDKLRINSTTTEVNCDNFIINGNLISEKGLKLGTKDNPLDSVFAEKIYGSYYTFNEADVAEVYETDKEYDYGTILQVGVNTEGEIANGTRPILGIVANKNLISLHMNTSYYETKKYACPVTLSGKIAVKVTGKVKRGQYLVFDNNGKAKGVNILSQNDYLRKIGVVIEGGTEYCIAKI